MIEFRNVSFGYNEQIFNDISFKIEKNKYYSIIGKNGSGKSTLLKLMAGIIKPTSGKISFTDSTKSDVGLVLQNPLDQFISDIVLDELIFGMENKLYTREKMENNIKYFSKILDIDSLLDKKLLNLSGGQRQRVAICSILCMEQKILLLDEVTSMLDPKAKKKFLYFIENIKKDYTIISISHDIEDTIISDEIIKIENNNVEILAKKQAYLEEKPYLYQINDQLEKNFKDYKELLEIHEFRN